MKEKIAAILEPIKEADGCGVCIYKEDGRYVYNYFGFPHKMPEECCFRTFSLSRGRVDPQELKEAAEAAIRDTGFKMYEGIYRGAPVIKLYLG